MTRRSGKGQESGGACAPRAPIKTYQLPDDDKVMTKNVPAGAAQEEGSPLPGVIGSKNDCGIGDSQA
ncbi:hypothetical protein FRC10_008579 [Ceratobasidium sp. 414]|nr:hypothetical protein FRC10_008579 [Ceratobasidium sp. 414]